MSHHEIALIWGIIVFCFVAMITMLVIWIMGPPQQDRDSAIDREMLAHEQWIDDKLAEGWHHWVYRPPMFIDVVQCERFEWGGPKVVAVAEVHPATNVAGLWWRPWRDEPAPMPVCPKCKGEGSILSEGTSRVDYTTPVAWTCEACGGSGHISPRYEKSAADIASLKAAKFAALQTPAKTGKTEEESG